MKKTSKRWPLSYVIVLDGTHYWTRTGFWTEDIRIAKWMTKRDADKTAAALAPAVDNVGLSIKRVN